MEKENDWLVAQLNNQSYSFSDFKRIGLTADNTQMLSKEEYKKNSYITDHPAFKNEQGEFSDAKFDKFYDAVSPGYQVFASDQFEDKVFQNLAYDPYNALRPYDSKIKDVTEGFEVKKVANPLRQKTGISNLGIIDNPEISIREAAESSKVYNWDKQKFEDYTPNDTALFENLFNFGKSLFNPLVLAQYEGGETSIDPLTGETITHKKGEYKVNEDGDYYYETLGNRNVYGKEVRSIWDNITAEGTRANNYDFFDSDGLDKSTGGIIMKTAAQILPLFVPGVQVAYGYMLLGSNLTELLPNMYKASIGLFTDESNPMDKAMNQLQGIGKSFNSSMSDTGRQKMLGLESLANIVSDVALQWAEQRSIMDMSSKVMGNGSLATKYQNEATEQALKYIASKPETGLSALEMAQVIAQNKLAPILKARNRASANLALGYMATLQGLETYEDALEQGASKSQAAALAWGAVAGMYIVDRTGLGEVFFPELRDVEREAERKVLTKLKEQGITTAFVKDQVEKATNSPKGLAKLFAKASEKSAGFWKDVKNNSTTIFEKIIAEGLEEVSEEAVTDLLKGTNNFLIDMGMFKQAKKLDAFDNALERYGMNFLGGAIGGAIFAGVDLHQNKKNPEQLNQELIYLIRNGKKQDLIEELDHMYKEGVLGDANLSATRGKANKDNTAYIWESGTKEDNQNLASYKIMKDYINAIDQAIYQNGLDLSDEQLLDKMVMGDIRMRNLLSHGQSESNKFGVMMKDGYIGTMLQDWNDTCSEILKKEGEIQQLQNQDDQTKRNDPDYDTKLAKLKTEKAELLKKRDEFLDGTRSVQYVDEMLFCMDPEISQFFVAPTFQNYVEYKTGQDYAKVAENQARLDELHTQYEEFKNGELRAKLLEGHKIYQHFNKKLVNDLGTQNENYTKYQQLKKGLEEGLINRDRLLAAWFQLNPQLNPENQEDTPIDMQTVGNILKVNGQYQIDPEAKQDYIFWDQPRTDEPDYETAKKEQEEHNTKVIENYRTIVQQLAATGYVDDEVKGLLLKHINYDQHINGVINTLKQVAVSYGLNQDIFSQTNNPQEIINNLKEQASQLSNINSQEILKNISGVINSDSEIPLTTQQLVDYEASNYGDSETFLRWLNGSGTKDDVLNDDLQTTAVIRSALNLDMVNYIPSKMIPLQIGEEINPDFPKQIMEDFQDQIEASLSKIEETFKKDENINLANQIKALTADPLTSMLHKLSIDTFGQPLSVIDILSRETEDLAKSPDITEFCLSPEAEDQLQQVGTLLDVLESVITGASTSKLDFGHNAVINQFLQKYFPKEQLYGVIGSDNAVQLRKTISQYRQKIDVLQKISETNGVNVFSEQQRSGRKTITLLSNGMLEKLKHFSYKGMTLLDGLESINVAAILDPDNNENYVEAGKLETLIHKNFMKMLKACSDTNPLQTVLKELFAPVDNPDLLKNVFDQYGTSIINGESSNLKGNVKEVTANDQLMWLATILSQDRAQFDQALDSALSKEEKEIAPLISQLIPIRIAVANAKQPAIFKALLGKFKPIQLNNTTVVSGIGGAGKTSVVAHLTKEILQILKPNSPLNIIKVGPTDVQLKNLDESLGDAGKKMTIEELAKRLLGPSYDQINKAIESGDHKQFFEITGNLIYTKPLENYGNLDDNPVDLVFIDEATFLNTVYAQHLAYAADKMGFSIILTGDGKQNGYKKEIAAPENPNEILANIGARHIGAVRTPNLNVSMRSENIQKFNNVNTTLKSMDELDITLVHIGLIRKAIKENGVDYETARSSTISEAVQQVMESWKKFKADYQLHYYENEKGVVTGEKVVSSINTEAIEHLLQNSDSTIGLIYDDSNSESYKYFEELKKNNLYKDRIRLYTPQQVQGSELDYFVVDVDFHPNIVKSDSITPIYMDTFMKNLYTIITRSKKGTWIKDNGLSKIFGPNYNKQDKSTTLTADKRKMVKKYKEFFDKILKRSIVENPYTEEAKKEDLDPEGTTPKFNEEKEATKSPEVTVVKQGETAYTGLLDTYAEPVPQKIFPSKDEVDEEDKAMAQSLAPIFAGLEKLQKENQNLSNTGDPENMVIVEDKDDVQGIIQHLPVYGAYFRLGCEQSGKNADKRYARITEVDDSGIPILSDLNNYLPHRDTEVKIDNLGSGEYLGEANTQLLINRLNALRQILQSGILDKLPADKLNDPKFKDDFKNTCGFIPQTLLGGSYLIKVKQYDQAIDEGYKMVGFDSEAAKKTHVTLVYRFSTTTLKGEKTYREITLGSLADPNTHLDYIKKLKDLPASEDAPYRWSTIKEKNAELYKNKYESWLKEAKVNQNGRKTMYKQLPKDSVTRAKASHFKVAYTTDKKGNKKRVKYEIEGINKVIPGTFISDPYIYADNDSEFRKLLQEVGIDTEKLKGRTIAFATAYPSILEMMSPDYKNRMHILFKNQLGSINNDDSTWENQMFKGSPLIRIVMLDPKSIYTFKTSDDEFQANRNRLRSQSGYLDPFWDEFKNEEGEVDQGEAVGFLRVPRTTNAKIFVQLWNFRVYLREAQKAINAIKQSKRAIGQEISKKELITAYNNQIASMPETAFKPRIMLFEGYGSGVADSTQWFANPDEGEEFIQKIGDDTYKVRPWKINPDALDTVLFTVEQFMNILIQFVPDLQLTVKGETKSIKELYNDTDNLWRIAESQSNELSAAINKGIDQPCSITFTGKDKDGNDLEPEKLNFSLTDADKVQMVLSKMLNVATYQANKYSDYSITIYGNIHKDENGESTHVETTKDTPGAAQIEVLRLDNGFTDNLYDRFNGNVGIQISFIRHLFNLILHGRNNPLYDGPHAGLSASESFFPLGYNVKSVYRPHNSTDPALGFHSTVNDRSEYLCDMGVEPGVMTISYDLRDSLEVQPEKSQAEAIKQFKEGLIQVLEVEGLEPIVDEVLSKLQYPEDFKTKEQMANATKSILISMTQQLKNGHFNFKLKGKTILAITQTGVSYTIEDTLNLEPGSFTIKRMGSTAGESEAGNIIVSFNNNPNYIYKLTAKSFNALFNRKEKQTNNKITFSKVGLVSEEYKLSYINSENAEIFQRMSQNHPELKDIINEANRNLPDKLSEDDMTELLKYLRELIPEGVDFKAGKKKKSKEKAEKGSAVEAKTEETITSSNTEEKAIEDAEPPTESSLLVDSDDSGNTGVFGDVSDDFMDLVSEGELILDEEIVEEQNQPVEQVEEQDPIEENKVTDCNGDVLDKDDEGDLFNAGSLDIVF